MRFLTIDTDKHDGIELTPIDGEYWILCGEGEEREGIQASPFVSVGIEQDRHRRKRAYLGEITLRDDDGSAVLLPPRDEEEPVRDRRSYRNRHPREPVLLLVNVPTVARLTQAAYDEEVVGGEVIHHYHPFDRTVEPPGVQILAAAATQWLLQLAPNAAFRIEYSQFAVSVRWTGIPDRTEVRNGIPVKVRNSGLMIRQFTMRDDRFRSATA